MDCLIELYDHEQLNNLVNIFAFRPKKVVFLYHSREVSYSSIQDIEKACRLKMPQIQVEAVKLDSLILDDITKGVKKVIWKNPNCAVDLTGGGELRAIGAYLACKDTFTPIFKVDLISGELVNVYGCKSLEGPIELPRLSLDSLLLAHGAAVGGYGHPKPPIDLHEPLLTFCKAVFKNIPAWKELCFYLQTGCTSYAAPANPLAFQAPDHISGPGGRAAAGNDELLSLANQLGLLHQFHHKGETISFHFKSDSVKKYLTDFGTWLELFVYITLCQSRQYDDVRISVKVDWNGMRQQMVEVTNEIDVTLFSGIHPVFISCKLSEPSSEALQELSVYSSYFGGRHSRCILVTLAKIDKERSHVIYRAKEMGISIIDGRAISSGKFLEEIQWAIEGS